MNLEPITWVDDGHVAACSYPRDEMTLDELAHSGVRVLINLHQRRHPAAVLQKYGLIEVHLPVPDFSPPTQAQLERGVSAIEQATATGTRVAVHCGGGLGRTGTLLACYLVKRGLSPDAAIQRVRELRPGSVETPQQEAAVVEYAGGRTRS